MTASLPADIEDLDAQLVAAERDAHALVAGVSESQGTARMEPASWSIA